MNWRMPRAIITMKDSPSFPEMIGSGGGGLPVTPYTPAPVVVTMPTSTPQPSYFAPFYAQSTQPQESTGYAAPQITIRTTQAPASMAPYNPVAAIISALSTKSPMQAYKEQKKQRLIQHLAEERRLQEATGSVSTGAGVHASPGSLHPAPQPPKKPPGSETEPGTWSEREQLELELAKITSRQQGLFFKCTDAAYAVKSAVDGLGLKSLKTTLWRWKGISGASHSAVIVYPRWGTPETGYVLDQWWAPSAASCYKKTDRPGGFAYSGSEWQKYDPTSARKVIDREQYLRDQEYNKDIRRRLKEAQP